MQGREAELHLGLDRVHPDDLHARGGGLGVVQQRGLADAGLAPDDEGGAVPLAGAGQDLVEPAAFLAASEQALHGANLLPGGPGWPPRPMGHVVGGAADHVPRVMPGSPPMADHGITQAHRCSPRGSHRPGRTANRRQPCR